MKFIFPFLAFVLTFSCSLAQEIFKVQADFSSKQILKDEIYFLEDKNGSLTLEEITKTEQQSRFQVIPKSSPNFGYSDSVFWLKIQVKKEKNNPTQDFFLELAYPLLDSITFFSQNETGEWQHQITGDKIPYQTRPYKHRNFIFPITLSNQQVKTFYIRLSTKGSIIATMYLHKDSSLRETQVYQEIFYGFYYGVLSIMVLYNLFIFFTLRDTNYLLYSLAIAVNIVIQANLLGHSIQYLWGDYVYWSNRAPLIFISLGFVANFSFSINFLKVKKYQVWLHYTMLLFMGVNFLLACLVFALDYNVSIKLITLTSFFSILLIITAGIWTWLKGSPYARLFVFAWTFYLIGVMLQVLKYSGVLPDSFWTQNSTLIGSILEVLFLSFALADRINVYRRKTEEAQKIALEKSEENQRLIQQQKDTLEQKVLERTKELDLSNQELVVQEEELRQNMEEIQAIQEALESQSQELSTQNRQIRSSINAAKTIQQAILPYETKREELLKDYFIIYRPKDIVSGDFYWLNQIRNKTVLAVVDCTGHGVPGAFMSLIGNTLLDKIVRVWEILNPADILSKLHNDIQIMLRQEETNNNYGMDMVVITWETLKNDNIELRFAGAKNSIYYLEPDANDLKELKGDRQSIGGKLNRKLTFTTHTLELTPDTYLYLGTDGLEDQNNPKRKKFGHKRLIELLLENSFHPFHKQKEILETTLKAHMKDSSQRDDILWMGFRL